MQRQNQLAVGRSTDITPHKESLKTCITNREKIVYRHSDHQLLEMAHRTLERFREKIEKSIFPLVDNITASGG